MSRQTKIFITIIAFTLIVLPLSLQNASEKAYAYDDTQIIYEEVLITKGDTITSIAEEYYDSSFGSLDDYIDTICKLNGLKNPDSIHYGNYICIPVKGGDR